MIPFANCWKFYYRFILKVTGFYKLLKCKFPPEKEKLATVQNLAPIAENGLRIQRSTVGGNPSKPE